VMTEQKKKKNIFSDLRFENKHSKTSVIKLIINKIIF